MRSLIDFLELYDPNTPDFIRMAIDEGAKTGKKVRVECLGAKGEAEELWNDEKGYVEEQKT